MLMKNIDKEIGNKLKSIQSSCRIKCSSSIDFVIDKLVTEKVSGQIYLFIWIRMTKLIRDTIFFKKN